MLESLPTDVQWYLLHFVEDNDLILIAQLNSHFRNLSDVDSIWRTRVQQKNKLARPSDFDVSTWKECYKKLKEQELQQKIDEENKKKPLGLFHKVVRFITSLLEDYETASIVLDSMIML